jgi:hypothetical protein
MPVKLHSDELRRCCSHRFFTGFRQRTEGSRELEFLRSVFLSRATRQLCGLPAGHSYLAGPERVCLDAGQCSLVTNIRDSRGQTGSGCAGRYTLFFSAFTKAWAGPVCVAPPAEQWPACGGQETVSTAMAVP